VTLEPDVEALVRDLMRDRGLSFKEAVNHAIRVGLAPRDRAACDTPTRDMGTPSVPLEKALELAGALEDEELLRKMSLRK
jgi:hypothetical protein